MTRSQYNYSLNIFEKETTKLIRSFFYKKQKIKIRIYITILIIPLLILGSSRLVKAELFYFYSPLCLGSWTYVRNVEGKPQISRGGDVIDFNNSNSAMLKNSGGQIFCGKFESSNLPDGNIREVVARLSLAIQEDKPAQFIPQDLDNGNILESEVDQKGIFIIDTSDLEVELKVDEIEDEKFKTESTPTPESTPTSSSEEAMEQTPTPEPELLKTESESEVETSLELPQTTPSPEPTPSSEPVPSTQPEVSTSFFNEIFSTAHAQEEIPLNLDDLLSVRYTLDGESWNELGRITRTNWNDLSFKIPVNSLDQISQLQISLVSLPTLDSAVTIYLDSIWLEAETEPTFLAFIKDIGETIIETLTLQNLATNNEETSLPIPELKETKLIKIKEYNFSISGLEKIDDELEWYTREDIQKLDKLLNDDKDRNIDVSTKNGSQNLIISGSCQDEFYVVLLYRNREDYSKNPSSAVYNSAFECKGKINHRLETENLTSGDYYLLIGEQGNTGTWIPISDLRKISLEITEKEIKEKAESSK